VGKSHFIRWCVEKEMRQRGVELSAWACPVEEMRPKRAGRLLLKVCWRFRVRGALPMVAPFSLRWRFSGGSRSRAARLSDLWCFPIRVYTLYREVSIMSKPLELEIATYERERDRLEREHRGKFVLIKGEEVIDAFDSFQAAADEAVRRFGRGPYLIRHVAQEKLGVSPAVLYGLTHACL
jgi:hypothetical protein